MDRNFAENRIRPVNLTAENALFANKDEGARSLVRLASPSALTALIRRSPRLVLIPASSGPSKPSLLALVKCLLWLEPDSQTVFDAFDGLNIAELVETRKIVS